MVILVIAEYYSKRLSQYDVAKPECDVIHVWTYNLKYLDAKPYSF